MTSEEYDFAGEGGTENQRIWSVSPGKTTDEEIRDSNMGHIRVADRKTDQIGEIKPLRRPIEP